MSPDATPKSGKDSAYRTTALIPSLSYRSGSGAAKHVEGRTIYLFDEAKLCQSCFRLGVFVLKEHSLFVAVFKRYACGGKIEGEKFL